MSPPDLLTSLHQACSAHSQHAPVLSSSHSSINLAISTIASHLRGHPCHPHLPSTAFYARVPRGTRSRNSLSACPDTHPRHTSASSAISCFKWAIHNYNHHHFHSLISRASLTFLLTWWAGRVHREQKWPKSCLSHNTIAGVRSSRTLCSVSVIMEAHVEIQVSGIQGPRATTLSKAFMNSHRLCHVRSRSLKSPSCRTLQPHSL